MRRTVLCLLLATLFVGIATFAPAQTKPAGAPPKSKVDSTPQKPGKVTTLSTAAIDQSKKADYNAAEAKAQKDYKLAIAKCKKRSTSAKRGCMADAKAMRTEALAQAKAQLGGQ
jgi:hypothetical protein